MQTSQTTTKQTKKETSKIDVIKLAKDLIKNNQKNDYDNFIHSYEKNQIIFDLLVKNDDLRNKNKSLNLQINQNKTILETNLNVLIIELKKEISKIIQDFRNFYKNPNLEVSKKSLYDLIVATYETKKLSDFNDLIYLVTNNVNINHNLTFKEIKKVSLYLKKDLISKSFLKNSNLETIKEKLKEIDLIIKKEMDLKKFETLKNKLNQ